MNLFRNREPDRTQGAQRRRASWLLLWMLPYLFFAIAGEGMHDHALLPALPALAPVPTSPATDGRAAERQAIVGQASGQSLGGNALGAPLGGDEGECLLCRWAANSSTVTPAMASLAVRPLQTVAVAEKLAILHSTAVVGSSSRGPPCA